MFYYQCQPYIRTIENEETLREREEIKKIVDQLGNQSSNSETNAIDNQTESKRQEPESNNSFKEASLLLEDEDSARKLAKLLERQKRKKDRLEKKISHTNGQTIVPASKKTYVHCATCKNPRGETCKYFLCKKCCKEKVFTEELECVGHRLKFRVKNTEATIITPENQIIS